MHEWPVRTHHPSPRRRRLNWPKPFILVAALVLSAAPCGFGEIQYPSPAPPIPPRIEANSSANALDLPDNNTLMQMNQAVARRAKFEAANTERMRQLNAASDLLLRLATELKADVDQAPRHTLSPIAVRRAEEIAQLAHLVQEKMKVTVGGN